MHPPLYFLLLDGWAALVGDSVFSVRLLSLLFGILGLTVTFVVCRKLFNDQAGLIVLAWLGTHSFFIYYCREARMYTLLLCLSGLSMGAYLTWLKRPTGCRTFRYVVTAVLLFYTHYCGFFILLTHGIHLLLTRPSRWHRWLLAVGLSLLLYTPWLPILWQQLLSHPDGPLILPVANTLLNKRIRLLVCKQKVR